VFNIQRQKKLLGMRTITIKSK